MPGPQPSATRITSPEAAWARSSGASGSACHADIPNRPSPMANAEAASIFIGLPFFFQTSRSGGTTTRMLRLDFTNGASGGGASPSGGGASPNGDDASPNGGDASDVPT